MAKKGFRVMDSDMHVMEPEDLWQQYIDPEFKERAPRGMTRWIGDMLLEIDGKRVPIDRAEEWEAAHMSTLEETYRDPLENGWDAASQIRAMEAEGIDLAVLYPTRGLYALAIDGMEPRFSAAIARAYNDWLHDFCSHDSSHIFGAGMVSPFDVDSAVTEVQRSVQELGFKAIFIRPNVVNRRNWHDPYFDPLWREIEDSGVPLGFHEGSNALLPQVGDRFETFLMHHVCCHPMEMMLAVVSFIGGGIMARFPKLRVGFLEGNCSWAPWLLWRLDEHYELSNGQETPDLNMKPVEYFKRQGFLSIEADEEPARFIEEAGLLENVVFSTDYPHADSKYPHAIDTFFEAPLSEQAKKQILWDNCVRLYGM